MSFERELYSFIYQFLKRRGVVVRRIGGMPDHVHILFDLPPTLALADLVKSLKTESSKVMRNNCHFDRWNGWSKRYGAFVVSAPSVAGVREYIQNQKAHHGVRDFQSEYSSLLAENGICEAEMLGNGD